jgi:hypothetical protein
MKTTAETIFLTRPSVAVICIPIHLHPRSDDGIVVVMRSERIMDGELLVSIVEEAEEEHHDDRRIPADA